ncbi:hypothetical protein [Actinoplanes sp. NPDC049681]|uniref:hypothetical protein n=1 Tax=Actinoplanes sp. NPDC049681 TaxID=3363905 RepID=UPI00379705D9
MATAAQTDLLADSLAAGSGHVATFWQLSFATCSRVTTDGSHRPQIIPRTERRHMRQRRLTAAVLSAAAGLTVTSLLTGAANASSVSSPGKEAPTGTPTKSSDSPTLPPSPTAIPRPALISGQITAVDATNGTISIATVLNGKNVTITLKVGVNTTALVDGVPTTLANVPVGAQVQVGGNDGGPLLRVTSQPKPLRWEGTLISVDGTGGTVSVKLATAAVTLPVGAGAKVLLDGTPVVLGALPVGAMLRLSGTETGTVRLITMIEARSAQPTATPKPTTSEPPKPAVTAAPKPKTSEPSKPAATTPPKPTTSETPKPAVTAAPKPKTSEPSKPAPTIPPKPTTSEAPKRK